jgi:hypothetical protein
MRGTTLPSPGPDGEPGQLTSAASSPERPRKLVERALGVVSDRVGGRDQQPERELRPPRLGQVPFHIEVAELGELFHERHPRPCVPRPTVSIASIDREGRSTDPDADGARWCVVRRE